MNPYEQDPSSSNGDANQGNGGYVNYYNPYVPSYVVDSSDNSSNPNTPVIIDSSASTATQYYSSYPNSDVNYNGGANYTNNYSNVVDSSSSGYYSNQQQPPVSEPSIVVINQRPTETVVQLPPQKIHDDKFDPVVQRELANSSNISAVSERTTTTPATTTAVASTTSYSNYNNNYALNTSNTSNNSRRRRRSWSCPTISCSCPSISLPSLDCYSFKKKFWLYALSVSAVVLALVLFGIGGALYGVVNSDYYCYNDPNGISYIHQGCCNVTISGCSYYKSTSYCRFTVSFPLLTSSVLQQDPKKGFGLTCSAAGKTVATMSTYTTYSSSYALSIAKTQFVDCYTNKYETVVSLQPYSELYSSYITGGIICFSFGASVLAFVLIKVGIWVYVKWKTS